MKVDHVDYRMLDKAKNAFISASRKTLGFAKKYGFVPHNTLGSSANVFALDLKPFFKKNHKNLFITLLPEGLGTADDARPDDLTSAQLERFWHNIGIKTVAALTNDAASSAMQTILISLYLPSSYPELVFNKSFMKGFLDGFVAACRQVGCVYLSGETPQLKNKIVKGKLDIAGALFAVIPPGAQPVDSMLLCPGDYIVFVQSSGPHENGFTTLRKLAASLPRGYHTKLKSGKEYWEAINAPSILYTPFIQDILKAGVQPTNIEPITGHGWQKLMRPHRSFRYVIEKMLPVPEIFIFVQEQLGLSPAHMIKIFNYGVGYAVFVRNKKEVEKVIACASRHGLSATQAGFVEKAKEREVVINPLGARLTSKKFTLVK